MDDEQKQSTRDRDVLPEHDHLDLIGKMRVENEPGHEREAGEQERYHPRLPPDDDGERAADFNSNDDREQSARYANRGHVGGGSRVRAELADSGQQEKRRE